MNDIVIEYSITLEWFMIHPFWLLNSALLGLLFLAYCTLRLLQIQIPERSSIQPKAKQLSEQITFVNIEKIYKKDLFNTVIEQVLPQSIVPEPLPKPPIIPRASEPQVSQSQIEPKFLDPLNIKLIGIFFVGPNKKENSAIIQNNTTNEEMTVMIGSKIQDASVIRIFRNKIIILRLNGQQEILYLREEDAKADNAYGYSEDWNDVIIKMNDYEYNINLQEFMVRISNIGELLYSLGVTTAYKNGKSIGCRIGVTDPKSIGFFLGFKTGDIITTINNKPILTTQDRLDVLQDIGKNNVTSIFVEGLRNGRKIVLTYTLKNVVIKPFSGNLNNKIALYDSVLQSVEHKKNLLTNTQNYLKTEERAMLSSKGKKNKFRY